ncbi:glutaredoxin 3 [Paracoccaceae bacterium GXU_MW_L88]
MSAVTVYSKSTCPFCQRALALLDSKGIEPEIIDLLVSPERRDEMIDKAGGRTTVPQIFIDGKHIGGSDELAALDRAGKLDPLLAA